MKEKMKDSGIPWIGQIPEDWEVCKIKFLCSEIFSGGTPSTNNDKYWNGDIPWLQSGKIQNDYIFEYDKTITKEGLENSSTKMVMKDSILLAMTGATCSNVGYLTFNSCANQSVMAYIPLKNTNPKFLFYILIACKNEILLHKNGGAQSGINGEVCQNLYAPKLPLKIQQKIVEILDKKCGQIDELVRIEENEIEKLKEYKTSLITKVVTKGLDPNAKMKDSGTWQLDRIPTNWQLKKLLYYLEMPITDGPHETPTLRDDGIPFISAESIKNNSIDFSKMRGYISNEYNSIISKKYSPKTNDIFIIKSGATTGNVAYVKDFVNFNIWSPLAVIRVNKYNYWKFIFYVLQSIYFQQQIQLSWSFGTQQNLSMRVLETLKIASPDIKVQHQIVECLDKKCEEIDNLIKIKQEKIEKLKEYKKSLIYQYVTGKKEVV